MAKNRQCELEEEVRGEESDLRRSRFERASDPQHRLERVDGAHSRHRSTAVDSSLTAVSSVGAEGTLAPKNRQMDAHQPVPGDCAARVDLVANEYSAVGFAHGDHNASDFDAVVLPPGTVIDNKYQLTGLLGRGGMGSVYRALEREPKREVALKLLAPSLCAGEFGRRRFAREARVAATLTHPVAVKIYDVGDDAGLPYIAMELLLGNPLRDAMVDGQPTCVARTLELIAPLVDVLEVAHRVGLVHRDLKPENIFLERAGDRENVRVLDFGLAFVEGDGDMGRLTREGLVVGTPAYLSPEQSQGMAVGPPSDVYALGCVTYELLTGWPPFRGSCMNILMQHVYAAPKSPRERAPSASVSSELDSLVLSMLAKQPHARPSMVSVRKQLEQMAGMPVSREMSSVPQRPMTLIRDACLPGDANLEVGSIGRLTQDVVLALVNDGVTVTSVSRCDTQVSRFDVFVVAEDAASQLAIAVQTGTPTVAIVDTSDVGRISQLLRLGVADVASIPVRIEDLSLKIRRAHARHQRKQS